MSSMGDRQVPVRPLRVALAVLILVEILFILLFAMERDAGNIPMIANSAGLIALGLLTWRGFAWSRWPLVALLLWRVGVVLIAASSHFAPGDRRLGGTLVLVAFYVAVGSLIASPLGRSGRSASVRDGPAGRTAAG